MGVPSIPCFVIIAMDDDSKSVKNLEKISTKEKLYSGTLKTKEGSDKPREVDVKFLYSLFWWISFCIAVSAIVLKRKFSSFAKDWRLKSKDVFF